MFNVICSILVTFVFEGIPFGQMENIKGTITSTGSEKFVVDFSKEATRLGLTGSYKSVLVDKNSCVEIKE